MPNTIVIGSKGAGLGCHFPECFSFELSKLCENVVFFDPSELSSNINKYAIRKELFPLSEVVIKPSWNPDLIFISETAFHFKNDINIPVFYLHNEMYRPLTVEYPNIIYFWHFRILQYFEQILAPNIMSNIKTKKEMPPAFNPEVYKLNEKVYLGVNGIGYRGDEVKIWSNVRELAMAGSFILTKQETDKFRKLGFNYFDNPISDLQYRELLPKCEALWICLPPFQYISRRILEAMACKTLAIFKLESEEHELYLKQLGFGNGKHYIGVHDLKEIKKAFEKADKLDIIENAYKIVLERHTYKKRAEQVLEDYKNLKGELKN